MSLEETKRLLRTYRITPNKYSGQNFMVEPSLYEKMCIYAALCSEDVVLDAGAGFGFLSCFMADKCRAVIAVERDPQVAKALRERVENAGNVIVVEGDVLKSELPEFNKVIAIPPYYLSTRLITWIIERRIDCAVMILQREFAKRLVAAVGSEDYGWLTVLTYQRAIVGLLDPVLKELFYPSPEVDSVIVSLKPWSKSPFEVKDKLLFRQMVKWIFTQRNKKICKSIVPFLKTTLKVNKQDAEKLAFTLPFHDRRGRELSPKDFGALANVISS
jgi:16S rRNA (adenine1518-N6/adenine1519-N6)-dimethyltransferase